jgi:hypothetical protein
MEETAYEYIMCDLFYVTIPEMKKHFTERHEESWNEAIIENEEKLNQFIKKVLEFTNTTSAVPESSTYIHLGYCFRRISIISSTTDLHSFRKYGKYQYRPVYLPKREILRAAFADEKIYSVYSLESNNCHMYVERLLKRLNLTNSGYQGIVSKFISFFF